MSTLSIQNPVLPGFHPDPSILRVGRDFYLATSTFEWWPGVRIHHSRDLVNWQHLSYALTRKSQLDMRGTPDSCGIWAPCLSHRNGTFYMVFTNVRSMIGAHKDTPNYVVTAPHPSGPWSEPIYLHSRGFDPSLFHDDDGRSWVVSQQWDHRAGHNRFHGILLQEYDHGKQRLAGPVKHIFAGSSLGVVEGPHLYKRDGWYYLVTAEGGTFYQHAVTVARSRTIDGPYELSPNHPLLTALGESPAGLQRAGHASLVDAGNGEWYIAHLCSRPLEWRHQPPASAPDVYSGLHSPLGRETALQRVEWTDDGWLRLVQGGKAPRTALPAPNLPPAPVEATPARDDFDSTDLSGHWNSLREPFDASWVSLKARPGHVRLVGRHSLMSTFDQSLLARRQQHFDCEAETVVEFEPTVFQQMAGLVAYYNMQNHAYLHVTHDEGSNEDGTQAPNNGQGGRVLRLSVNDRGVLKEPAAAVPIGDAARVWLRVRFIGERFQFFYALNEGDWQPFGEALPARMLSDEYATLFEGGVGRSLGFTGNFIGIACQDLTGSRLHADFDYFSYRELPA